MYVQFFTHSGSRYQLGRPAPWYLEELVQRNYWNEEDPLNPLMVRRPRTRTDPFTLKTPGAFLRTRGPSVLKAEGAPCLLTSGGGIYAHAVQAFWKLSCLVCMCQALNRDEMMAIDRDSEEEDEEEDDESDVHTTIM